MKTLQEVITDRCEDPNRLLLIENLGIVAAAIDERIASGPHLVSERNFKKDSVPGSIRGTGVITNRHIELLAGFHGLSKLQLIEFAAGGIVVDVGCGQSDFLDWFKSDALTVAVDKYKPHMLYQQLKGHQGILACGSDMSSLPSDSVRLLHASFSLPFWARSVTHARQVADEYARVLEPGGMALIGAISDRTEHPEHELVITAHRLGMTSPLPWGRDFEPYGTIVRAAFYKRLLEHDDITITGHRYPFTDVYVDKRYAKPELQMPNFLMIQKTNPTKSGDFPTPVPA